MATTVRFFGDGWGVLVPTSFLQTSVIRASHVQTKTNGNNLNLE